MELLSQAEVEKQSEGDAVTMLRWLREVVAVHNPELVRRKDSAAVCPFVPNMLLSSALWFAQSAFARMLADLAELRAVFPTLLPTDEEHRIRKVVLLIVPDMPVEVEDDGTLLPLLEDYLRDGIKLTVFHPESRRFGLHNPDFRSRRSPVPVVNVRYLHRKDENFVRELHGTREGDLLEAAHARLYS